MEADVVDCGAHAAVYVPQSIDSLVLPTSDSSPSENMRDLFSSDYFAEKLNRLAAKATADDFEPWESARERYIQTKIEPLLDQYRLYDHDWFKDFNRRRGVMMHSSDLIYKLQLLNPHVTVQQQINFSDDWGLYTTAGGKIQFLTGLPKGWLTEFSYSLVDERNLPLEERRGWRTVLIYCLMKGALDWGETVAAFGEPLDACNEERWATATRDFRYGGEQTVMRNISNLVDPSC